MTMPKDVEYGGERPEDIPEGSQREKGNGLSMICSPQSKTFSMNSA